jgi:hypothetical protein
MPVKRRRFRAVIAGRKARNAPSSRLKTRQSMRTRHDFGRKIVYAEAHNGGGNIADYVEAQKPAAESVSRRYPVRITVTGLRD